MIATSNQLPCDVYHNRSEYPMYPNLKLQLWHCGLRQNGLAKLLGVDETMLSKIVNGYREPNPELRAKIAALLKREEEWLFNRVEKTITPR